ncbi:hypothetical protein AMECASPLE_013694 [Ameca splendens]|uniref:Secreted protein n=1 Tax=Ameca splendens TaxID=208324 RepID=A0ABV0Z080_9TELE
MLLLSKCKLSALLSCCACFQCKLNCRLSQSVLPGDPGVPEHRPQVVGQISRFFVHIANIPEKQREDHLHGHANTHRHCSGRHVKRVPAVYINRCKMALSLFLKGKI